MERFNAHTKYVLYILFFLLANVLLSTSVSANTFVFNPKTLTWKALDDSGKVVRVGKGSGGRSYCPDIRRGCKTPSGVYRIISKGSSSCRSSRYPVGKGGAPMPYCMFFSRYYAIHGSHDVPSYNASHGCVRVTPASARWLSQNFIRIGTQVIIQSY
jgi:lipoprotein-anchoring transpeptidase ErfK/SrfK